MKRIFTILCLCLSLLVPQTVNAEVTVLARSYGQGGGKGFIPEVDALNMEQLRTGINAILKGKAEELLKEVGSKGTIDFRVVLRRDTLFSVVLTAEGPDKSASKGVNIDLTTGKEVVTTDFFRDAAILEKLQGAGLMWVFGTDGIYAQTEREGAFTQFIPYAEFLTSLKIGEAERFLPVYNLTQAAFDSVVRIKSGELVRLCLEANRTTGYSWSLADSSIANGVLEIGKGYIMPALTEQTKTGVAGVDLLVLSAAKPGEYLVTIEYKRQWENVFMKTQQFHLVVVE